MRYIFTLTLLLFFLSPNFAQQKKKKNLNKIESKEYKINKNDFSKSTDTTYAIYNKTFKFNSGENKPVEVLVSIYISNKDLESPGIGVLNQMLEVANIKATYEVKNKYTYVPRKISLFKSSNNYEWNVFIEFTAQNDFGATKDSKSYYLFNNDGDFLMKL